MMLSNERLGRFTASRISDLFIGPRGGRKDRDTYVFEKAEEIVKGHAEMFSNKFTQHGEMNEQEAIEMFGQVTGLIVEPLGQKYFPINSECGSTPDAQVLDLKGKVIASCDMKCPPQTFFKQKMLLLNEGLPEYQNSPKQMYYQAQMQMMSLNVDQHYLVRYLTKMGFDDYTGDKIEYDLPIETRLFYKVIKADTQVQEQILKEVEQAAKERDLLVAIFKKPILQNNN